MKKDNKGFTLIELIVVVLIIAIIAVAMTPQVTKWVKKSRIAMDDNNAGTLKTCFDVALVESLVGTGGKNGNEYIFTLDSSKNVVVLAKGTKDSGSTYKWYTPVKGATPGATEIQDTWLLDDSDSASSVINNVSGKTWPKCNVCKAFYVVIKDDGVTVNKLISGVPSLSDTWAAIAATNFGDEPTT